MKYKTTHKESLNALRRVEGQIKGIQNMVNDEKYCIDIINQIYASVHALHTVAEKIFAKHIGHCVKDALSGKSEREKDKKIHEIMKVIKKFRKVS